MAAETTGQKTEKPTPKKLRDARKKGQIARSPDLVGWVALFVATFVIPSSMVVMADGLRQIMHDGLLAARTGDDGQVFSSAMPILGLVVRTLTPLFFVIVIVTIVGMVVQGGVTLSLHPLKPKFERISPKSGVKRLFSSQSLVDTGKAILRLVVLVVLVLNVTTAAVAGHLGGAATDLSSTLPLLGADVLTLVRLAAVAGIIVGLGDYAFQRHKTAKQLKMSKYEVKQEAKNTEGDASMKHRRRSMHSAMNRNQMLAAVPDASVVLVNPTHVAVAITYHDGGVPTVVAKGGDELALRIRERATESDVPILEVRPLARLLHDTVDVGSEIPANLYEAIATVIAFVMRTPASAMRGSIRRVSVPARAMRAAQREAAEAS